MGFCWHIVALISLHKNHWLNREPCERDKKLLGLDHSFLTGQKWTLLLVVVCYWYRLLWGISNKAVWWNWTFVFCCSCHKTIRVVNGKQGQHLGITSIIFTKPTYLEAVPRMLTPELGAPGSSNSGPPFCKSKETFFMAKVTSIPKQSTFEKVSICILPFVALCGQNGVIYF